MSTNPFRAGQLLSLDEESAGITADVRVISGAYIATANKFISDVQDSISNMVELGVIHTLDDYLPTVALKDGPMRKALEQMFTSQMRIEWGGANFFQLKFDRALLEDPIYLKYHDIEWALNPKFALFRSA